jgi:hypothetical protein
MSHTSSIKIPPSDKILVNTRELAGLLSIGYNNAADVGERAGATVKIGRRKLYNVEQVKHYIATNNVI